AMGSLYNAKFVGSPVLITAGQQEQGHGLTEPLLYDPLVPIAQPVVKWAIEVNRLEDLPRIVHRAAKVALTPPTGPVFISLPGDILNMEGELDLGAPTRVDTRTRPVDEVLQTLARRLLQAERPAIIAGHELQLEDALAEAGALAQSLGAAVYQQTVQHGAHFISEHPNFVAPLSRTQADVRRALSQHDLLICLGSDVLRMSVYSPVDPLPDDLPVIQLGQRDWEMGKNYPAENAVRCALKPTLPALCAAIEGCASEKDKAAVRARNTALLEDNWTQRRARLVEELAPRVDASPIDPDCLMQRIADRVPTDGVVVDESILSGRLLQHLYPYRDRNAFFGNASGGIGFSIAAAIGVSLALPGRPLVATIGDGSAMYSIQALWTAAHHELPITFVICNNGGYRIIKERLFAFHRNNRFIGMDFENPALDFVKIAQGMGLEARRIDTLSDFDDALAAGIASGRPNLLDVHVARGDLASR
ncbi:MAG: thiamine pyrophosphate-binding protein, partial [Gammaproteobacteria bacterium]|nr:thiamine pyrophosphate-binding protein [Gammaproteobacteria bacterium]